MMDMDKIDASILRELSLDGRLPNTELADRIGLSPSACLRRVQALERSGVIKGYRAVLDPQAMGHGFTSYVSVGLNTHTTEAQTSFEDAVSAAPEIVECHNITGTVEYLLRVEVADLAAYKRLHANTLGMLPGVNSLTTFVVMASPKDLRA